MTIGLVCTSISANSNTVLSSRPDNPLVEISSVVANAPQNTVQGVVRGADGPLSGVSVSVVGTNVTTMTDARGAFQIQANQGATLRFTSVGYQPLEMVVSSNTITINMSQELNPLEEVVIVGYGRQQKQHLTGAVSTINAEEVLGSRPIPDFARGLQGAMPGLSIRVGAGGEIGSDPVIKIRGHVGSVAGGSDPLILVDNVEVPSIQYVNPNDIESVTILKDAASASIYGAKAAFGVILITTKKGEATDVTRFSYNNNFNFQTPFKDVDIAGIDGLQYSLDAHRNMNAPGAAGGFWRVDEESIERIKEWQEKYAGVVGDTDPVLYNRDWYLKNGEKFGVRIYDPAKLMIKDFGFSQIHNLGLTGKSGNTNYSMSLGYLGQEGMFKPAKNDDFRRLNPSLNLTTKLNEAITLRGGARYSESQKRYPNSLNADGFAADPWLYMYRWSRLFPVGVQENGVNFIDPVYSAQMSNDKINTNKFLNLNLGTTINLMKNWDLNVDYAYSTQNNGEFSSVPYVRAKSHWYGTEPWRDAKGNQIFVDENGMPTQDLSIGVPAYQFPMDNHTLQANTYVYQNYFNSNRNTFNAFSTYELNLNGGHDFKAMVGTNIVAYDWKSNWIKKSDLINGDNPQFAFAIGTEEIGASRNWDSQVGFFGRLNYAYQDKYLLEANLRYDGTSKFPSHLRWKYFPSISGGWVLSNESFMESLKPVLSFAKLRASWGTIGDQSVSNSLYIPTMGFSKNNWLTSQGIQFMQLGTPGPVSDALTWQDIEHLNVGADLRFFGGKLGVVGEWYERTTNNMIIAGDALPATFGASAPQGNFGTLRTRGWEVNVDYSHRFSNGLNLRIDANLYDAISHTVKGADWQTSWENRNLSTTFSTGRRYGDIYGFVTDRLFQKEDFVYDDNGNHLQTVIIYDGVAKTTNVLKGENPVYQVYFEDGNQTLLIKPGDVKFVDVNGDGYINAGNGTNGDPGDRVVIGNSTPRYQYGLRLNADYKGFDLGVFFQGVGARQIWGVGQMATPGYYSKEGAMPQAIAGDYWREDRTDAFYPRAWNLNGSNEGFVMRAQSRYLLDMSYLKIKNITVGYSLPQSVSKRLHIGSARLYMSFENFITFDNLRGLPIDPEAITGHSSLTSGNYNLGRTGTGNPSFKSASFGLQVGF